MKPLKRQRHRTSIDPRLIGALGATLLFHGSLLMAGSYRKTYDAWVHLFFADHYRRDWFSTWEPRWYTGFPTISYPPGTHQALALLGQLLGVDGGYVAFQLSVMLLLVIGVYRFAKVWQGERAAGWAALAVVLSSSLSEVVHVFGQLPTTAALAFLLNAQPFIRAWIVEGRRRDLAGALALLGATTAVHHVTTLFGSVFFTGPIVAAALLDGIATPGVHEPKGHTHRVSRHTIVALVARRALRITPALRRTALLGVATITLLVMVILPYWLWSSSDPIAQVPIPHGSRDNFLENTNTGLVFWLVPWASLLLLFIPCMFVGLRRRVWPLAASILLLSMLGTGGTTPIPRMLLGGAFDILTLDRFTIWATIAILPFVGTVIDRLVTGGPTHLLARAVHRHAPHAALIVVVFVAAASTLFASSLTNYRPTQPDAIDPAPIAAFMERDDHDRWRYLMLGFGDQMANVSAKTTARTVDGNYHSARRLPELTSHSVERLEGAKFRGVAGLGSLHEFVGTPARYNLKFIFSNDAFYDPMLWAAGWQRIGALDTGIVIWEKTDVPPLLVHEERPEIPSWQRVMWGILPPSAMAAALIALVTLGLLPSTPIPERSPPLLDRWLLRRAHRLQSVAETDIRSKFDIDLSVITRHAVGLTRIGLAVLAALMVTAGIRAASTPPPGPEDAVLEYFDHLAFQRFDQAWATLDQDSRPSLQDYLTGISVRDGLIDGYAELQDITVLAVESDGVTAVVDVELVYLTAVEVFTKTSTLDVRFVDDHWGVVPPSVPDGRATATTLSRTQETHYQLDTSTPADEPRLPAGSDRPQLRLGPARALTIGNQWYVVGEVTNIDDRPAYITIDVTARAADGTELATMNPTMTMHTARPGETVPFLTPVVQVLEPDELATRPAVDFDPDQEITPLVSVEPNSFEVSARAVVAVRGLERELHVEGARMTDRGVETTILNAGLSSATAPRVLLTILDANGDVLWVRQHWIDRALRPGSRTALAVDDLVPSDLVDRPDIVVETYADDLGPGSLRPLVSTGQVGIALQVSTFERTAIE